MKKTFFLLPLFALCLLSQVTMAVPARRTPFDVVQPNGDTLTICLVGDERWHCHYTADGLLIAQNKKGYYCYATWSKERADKQGVIRRYAEPTRRKAHNADKRSKCEQRWIIRHKIPNRN